MVVVLRGSHFSGLTPFEPSSLVPMIPGVSLLSSYLHSPLGTSIVLVSLASVIASRAPIKITRYAFFCINLPNSIIVALTLGLVDGRERSSHTYPLARGFLGYFAFNLH